MIANGSSTIDTTYDAGGRVLSSTIHSAALGAVTMSYSYDAVGNRVAAAGPDGTIRYAYDSEGRLVGVTDPSGGAVGLAVPPESTPIMISIEFALLAGEYSALLDKFQPEGASC